MRPLDQKEANFKPTFRQSPSFYFNVLSGLIFFLCNGKGNRLILVFCRSKNHKQMTGRRNMLDFDFYCHVLSWRRTATTTRTAALLATPVRLSWGVPYMTSANFFDKPPRI